MTKFIIFNYKGRKIEFPRDIFLKSSIFKKIKEDNEFDKTPYSGCSNNDKNFEFENKQYKISDENISELFEEFKSFWRYSETMVDFNSLCSIVVNVRGTLFITTELTLRKSQLFSKIFNKEIKPMYYKQVIYFDRCPKMFAEILNFMTDDKYFVKKKYRKNIRREAEFYGVEIKIPIKTIQYDYFREKGPLEYVEEGTSDFMKIIDQKIKTENWKMFGGPFIGDKSYTNTRFHQFLYKTNYVLE